MGATIAAAFYTDTHTVLNDKAQIFNVQRCYYQGIGRYAPDAA